MPASRYSTRCISINGLNRCNLTAAPQVLTGKFQRAMDSKVEAEERALRAETRAAQQEHELAQACALAQFCEWLLYGSSAQHP
jgi:hypothetical protein